MEATPLITTSTSDKTRLTEQEKKQNHIQSEQKRRQAIREGFDDLAALVPGCKGQGRSEATVLFGAVDHISSMLAERHRLMARVSERGGNVDRWVMDEKTMQKMKEAVEEEEARAKRGY
jgi:heteromeric Ino2p/Ino4p transcription factor